MVNSQITRRLSMLLCLGGLVGAPRAVAQEIDIMVQQSSGQLVIGVAELFNNSFTIPNRVFTRNLLSNFRGADPGFFSLSEGNPLLPAEALPANTDLHWDFLPMTVDQSVSNLFYWDGLDDDQNGFDTSDVDFVRPDNTNFKVINNGTFTADASNQMVTGGLVETTEFDGSIHKHPAYRVETLDATTPAEGVYLVSKQVRMEDIDTSEPFFIAFRTSTLGNDALTAAADWIEMNIGMLTSPPMLNGDYNGDGMVNIADYTVWRDTLGSTTNLAANGDDTDGSQGIIDVADYDVWRANFGVSLVTLASGAVAVSTVPEPSAGVLIVLGATFASLHGRR